MPSRFFILALSILSIAALAGLGFFYFNHSHFLAESDFLAQVVNKQTNGAKKTVFSSSTIATSTLTETAFITEATSTESEKQEGEATVIFVGDIMLSRAVAQKIKQHNDFNYPFLKISDYLRTADLVFGNLETSLTKGRKIGPEEMVFRAAPEMAFVLRNSGFSVISLANNHTMNFGQAGLIDTMLNLTEVGVAYAGAGRNAFEAYWPTFITKNNLTFAFLAYTDNDVIPGFYLAGATTTGVAYMDKKKMEKAVKLAKIIADVVVVSMHSGWEYKDEPNQRQMNFARAAIDMGADLVIGHHPHVVQIAEKYKGKYIFYSLGNFIFDQRWWKTKEGIILKAVFNKNGLLLIEPQAIYIDDFSQPTLLNGEAAKKIIARLKINF